MHTMAVLATLLLAFGPLRGPDDKPSIVGGWTLNRELSDAPIDRSSGSGDRGDAGGGRSRGQGGGRRGGFGGGFGGGGRSGGGQGGPSREDMARIRDAMRQLTEAPGHLVITETPSIVVITGDDGRTTRLSPDGKKIKDDNTGIERKTKWDGGRLVIEISGLRSGKATETYAVEPDTHRLRIAVQMEGGRSGKARTITHVYDADAS